MLSGHLSHIGGDDGVDHRQRLSFGISPQGLVEPDGIGSIAKGFEAHPHGSVFERRDVNHGRLRWNILVQCVRPIAVAIVKRVLTAP